MPINTISTAERELQRVRDRGANTVRISADLLEALLGAHALLSAAFQEIETKNEA